MHTRTRTHRPPSSALCLLTSVLCLLSSVCAPPARAQNIITTTTIISTTDALGPLSQVQFSGPSGTIEIAASSTLVFDSAGTGTTNRLAAVTAGNSASFLLDDNSTLTFSGNAPGVSGGAISVVGANTGLTLSAVGSGRYVFTGNTATGQGGAINGQTAVIDITNALFDSNTSTSNGGALNNYGVGSKTTLHNVTFQNNFANGGNGGALSASNGNNVIYAKNVLFTSNSGNIGGALFAATSATVTVISATFQNNASLGTGNGGGAVGSNGTAGVLLAFNDVLFQNNTAVGSGGAAYFTGAGASGTFKNVRFLTNTAGGNGGAIDINAASVKLTLDSSLVLGNTATGTGGAIFVNTATNTITLIDTSLLNNVGADGAIYLTSNYNTVNITVSDGSTSRIAGSAVTAGGASTYSLNYTANNSPNTIPITINTGSGATFDMLDPFNVNLTASGAATNINKTGLGTWKLSGTSVYSKIGQTSNYRQGIFINAGTLYLYREGEQVADPNAPGGFYTAHAGVINFQNGQPLGTSNTNASLNFTLAAGANLSVGGGNAIIWSGNYGLNGAYVSCTFANHSNLTFDLGSASAKNSPAALLSVNVFDMPKAQIGLVTGGNFNPYINLTNLDLDPGSLAGTYNLFSLAGIGANVIGASGVLSGINFANLVTSATYNGLAYSQFAGDSGLFPNLTITAGLTQNATNDTLWIKFDFALVSNNVLLWTGAIDGAWAGSNANWLLGASGATPTGTSFTPGDIVNLADPTAPATTGTTTLNVAVAGATVSALYVSGTDSYTITGGPITATATTGTFPNIAAPATPAAATGQLVLGARALDDATAATTTPYTGTLTLLNTTNTFTNGIVINAGALVGNAANLAVGAGATATIAPGASLTFNQPTPATYSTPIAGQGLLFKTNTAALTLAADNSAFTGQTQVLEGKLLLPANAALGGAITVANAATLAGSGSAASVTIATGATLQIGDPSASGLQNFRLSELFLSPGSILDYTLNISNTLAIATTLAHTGATTINIAAMFTGSRSLIDLATGFAPAYDTSWLGVNYNGTLLAPGVDYTLTTDNNLLWLTILQIQLAANNVLNWTNATGDTLWLASANWTIPALGPAVTSTFAQGDIVNLSGADSPLALQPFSLSVLSSATASAIYVSGTASYAIALNPAAPAGTALTTATGVGYLATATAATGKLVLGKTASPDATTITATAFAGTLDLTGLGAAENNFTQGVEIASGALRVSTTGQLGAPLSKLQFTGTPGATGNSGTLIIAGNLTLDSAGGATHRLTLTNTTAGAFLLEAGNTLTFSNNTVSTTPGGAITLSNASALTLAAAPGAQYIFSSNTVTGTDGGAISVANSTLVLTATANGATAGAGGSFLFTGNTAQARGGAIFATTATVAIDHAAFLNSTGSGNGGAIAAVQFTNLTLSNVLFSGNTGNNSGALHMNTGVTVLIQSSTFNANSTAAASGNGGAIWIQSTGANASFVTMRDVTFTSNKATASGGAIALQTNGSGFDITGALFQSNTAGNAGGAFYLANANIVTITNGTFLSNASGTTGGVISLGAGSGSFNSSYFEANTSLTGGVAALTGAGTLAFTNATFLNNTAQNGGAINAGAFATTVNIANSVFDGNKATSGFGGAINHSGSTAVFNIASTLFKNNTASIYGGAIGSGTTLQTPSTWNFTNVSFLDNSAAGANGGAIVITGSGFWNFNVTTSATIAGNTAAGAANAIHVSNYGSPRLTFNISPGAQLDMPDPITARLGASNYLVITQTGGGLWNLGGNNTLAQNAAGTNYANITIASGTLHLYRAGETSGAYTAQTGNITYGAINTGTFTLATPATLSAGGGNTITAPVINLGANSTLAFDLLNATPNSTSLLTLNATTTGALNGNGWNQNLSLLNTTSLAQNNTYNLITISGATFTSPDYFSLGSLDLSLYHLQLTADKLTLQLFYGALNITNNVITWTAAAGGNNWGGANWALAGSLATSATYTRYDIANLASAETTPVASSTINIGTANTSLAGMNLSGPTNYTITGNPITTTATAGSLASTPAATGQLILGAIATTDPTATTALTTLAYTGTLTLSNSANTFQNGIDIRTGALVGNAANLATGPAATINIASPASLTFNQLTSATYSTPITGAGTLNKTGTATLTLLADSSAFTGQTTVASGKLLLASSGGTANAPAPGSAGVTPALGGAIQVASGATFGGSGTAGSVTLAPGATLQVGLADSPLALQPFSLSALSLSPGSILTYTAMDNQLLVTGNVTLLGPATITLAATTLTTGSYSLIDALAGYSTGFDTALLAVTYKGKLLDPLADYHFATDTNNILWLDILNVPITGNNVLTWTNATNDSAWLASKNWRIIALAADTNFMQGDIVNLASAETTHVATATITLAAPATLAGMNLSGATNYTLAGPGSLTTTTATTATELTGPAATGKLILGANATDPATPPAYTTYTGTLDLTRLAGPNNFQNGVEINSGALRVSTTAQLGTTLSKLAFTGNTAGAATPTLIIAANSDMLFDSATTTANRLTIPAAATASFLIEDNAHLTIANNYSGAAGGAITLGNGATLAITARSGAQATLANNAVGSASLDGGAIFLGTNALLTLDGSAAGSAPTAFLFTGNIATNRGGAIFASATNTVNITNATFTANANPAAANGGALVAFFSSSVTLTNVLFTTNTSGGIGGAIFANTNSQVLVQSATFANNDAGRISTSKIGGAIAIQGASVVTVNDALFTGNYAVNNGGAIGLQSNNSSVFVTRALFTSNSVGTNGGALYIANIGTVGLTDVSFTGNYSGSFGAAIMANAAGAVVNYNVSSGSTSQIAGNISGTGASAAPSGIYFAAFASQTLAINVATAGSLDMLDPVSAAPGATLTITKTGSGAWNLAGPSTLNGATLAIAEGTLHLYGKNETSTTPTGTFTAATPGSINIPTGGSLTLAPAATLSAAGANTITAPAITLAPASILALDMAAAIPNTPALLTLNTTTATGLTTTNWTQTLSLLNLGNLEVSNNDLFNLITLTGPGASTNLFTTAAFNNLTDIDGLLGGFTLKIADSGSTLQLLYSNDGLVNQVLAWTALNDTNWRGLNWLAGGASGTAATYVKGDIVNLAGSPASTTIKVDSAAGAVVAGMYVSGTASYTITGNSLTTTATIGTLAGTPAATGQLILGAKATDNATAVNTLAYTGTLTLANTANNFENGIDIRSGALIGNALTLATGTAPGVGVTIAAPASLTFNQLTSATYSTPITGAGSLTKTGPATLTLTANNSAFTGHTEVQSGALLLGSAPVPGAGPGVPPGPSAPSLGGNIHVSPAATFGGAGTAGSVTLAPAATLQIGLGTTGQQNLTLASLSLAPSSLLDYTNISNQLLVTTTATLLGDATINLQTIATGSYSLINATGAGGGLTGFNPALINLTYRGALIDTDTYRLATTPSQLWLIFTILPNNIITWNNAASDNLWLTSTNYTIAGATGNYRFHQGDIVNLAGAAATTPITLAATATASAIYISGNASYTLAGSALATDPALGILAGGTAANGKLTLGKNATDPNTPAAITPFNGTLDLTAITGTNNFANGVEINTGWLRVANAAQLGTTLNKLTLNTGTDTITNSTLETPSTIYYITTITTRPTGGIEFAGDTTLDARGTPANHLAITGSIYATFYVDDGATLTIANNTTGTHGGAIIMGNRSILAIAGGPASQVAFTANAATGGSYDGGAIFVGSNASLFLGDTATPATFLFTGNTAQNRGGAIFGNTANIHITNATFTDNKSTANGGAIGILQKTTATLTNVLFASNTGNYGGAIFANTNSVYTVQSATFANNTSLGSNGGGALSVQGTSAATFNDTLFTANSAINNGGAILLQTNGSKVNVYNSAFIANTSGASGGAAALINNNNALFSNVTFNDNTAATNGGAIHMAGATATVYFDVSTGSSAQIAGNTSGASRAPNSVYMAAVANQNIGIATGDGANLDMLDPIAALDAINAAIIKSGPGAWNLGGNTTIGTGATIGYTNLYVRAGLLHLYAGGETSISPATGASYTATKGNITMTGASSFQLSATATLYAGGGNTISAPGILIHPDAAFTLDLLNALPNTPSYSILTLNAGLLLSVDGTGNYSGWNQTLDLRNIDTLAPAPDGTAYNLITLSGSGATGIYQFVRNAAFASPSTFTLTAPLPANYSLQLTPNHLTLQLLYTAPVLANSVLTTTAASNTLLGANWTTAGATGTFNRGDIINIDATGGATTLAINTISTATLAALYITGTANTTITGNPIVTDPAATLLAGDTAATGQLVLGAKAADNAASVTPAPYTGTLTLSNTTNTFLGGIAVNSGALVGNDKTLGVGLGTSDTGHGSASVPSAGIFIAAPGSVTFNQLTSGTTNAPITGAGTLTKTGSAPLTLTADSSSFTGTTTIASGKLLLASGGATADAPAPGSAGVPPALGGAIQVASGATFGAAGAAAAGTVTLAPAATLQVGLASDNPQSEIHNPQSLTLASLTLSASSILDYSSNPDYTTTLHLATPATAAAPFTLNIATYAATATHTLGNIATLAPNATVTIAGATQYPDARSQATLSTAGADLILTTYRDPSRNMTWTGSTSGTWALTGANWLNSATGVFGTGDQVHFNDTGAAQPAITIAPGGVTASDIFVDGATNYTFTGAPITTDASSAYAGAGAGGVDPAAATGKLYKTGPSTLTLNTTGTNQFLGGIDLLAGTLSLSGTTNAAALTTIAPNATLQMTAAGRLNAADLALAGSSTLTGSGTIRFNNLALAGGIVQAAIPAGNTLVLSSTTVGGTANPGDGGILKTGAGELQFNGAGALGDSTLTQIDQGTVRFTGFNTATAKTIPGGIYPLISGSYLLIGSNTLPVTAYGETINVPPSSYYITAGYAPGTTVGVGSSSYSKDGYSIVIPSCTTTIAGSTTIIPSSTVVFPYSSFTVPGVTGTVTGPFIIVPNIPYTIPNYFMDAASVAQNMILNGGTVAFGAAGAAATASGASGGNDNLANNWLGLRFIQSDSAASSVITGVNDIAYISFSGTFLPQLTSGLHVDINPADGGVVVLGNNANTFAGIVIADSGTLQVTDLRQIGTTKTVNNTQIALYGGIVEFSPNNTTGAPTAYTLPGDIAIRSSTNTLVVDDNVSLNLARIYRNASFTPNGAVFVKAGSGTMTLSGTATTANQATSMVVDGGRFIVTATGGLPVTSGPFNGQVTVNAGAVIQLSRNVGASSGTTTGTMGLFAGAQFTVPSTGTINNAFQGAGTLEITDSQQVLTNGKTDIANLNITGATTALAVQAFSLGSTGTVTVDAATLVLAATVEQTLGNIVLKNGAKMGFLMSGTAYASSTNAVTGIVLPAHYGPVGDSNKSLTIASLTAAGPGVPALWFNANITNAVADHLTITNAVTGTFSVNVANVDTNAERSLPPVPPQLHINLELITSPAAAAGAFSPCLFTIGTPTIDLGNYRYYITDTTTTAAGLSRYSINITGNGDMSKSAAAIYTAAAMFPVSWFAELDSVTQRLGDLHFEERAGKAGFSAWTRGYAERLDFNRRLTGTGFNERHLGAEAGLDYKFGSKWNIYAGAFMGYGQGQRDFSNATDASNESVHGGAYATLVEPATGWYLDALVKYNRFRSRYATTDPSTLQSAAADYHNNALGASLEIGKRQQLPYDWYLTPALQFATTRINAQNYDTTNGIHVDQSSGAATRGRAGFTFGRDFETQTLGTYCVYIKGYYGWQWTTGGALTITPPGYAPGCFDSKIKGYNLAAGAGLAWQFTKATQFYLDYELTQADYYIRPYGLNAGIRHQW